MPPCLESRPVLALLRHRRRFHAWIACLALFGLVLAPSISHALARIQGQASLLTQICTPQGMKTVSLATTLAGADAAQTAPESDRANPMDHCPLCGLSAAAPVLPSPEVVIALPLAQATAVPRLFLRAPRPLFVWSAAQPRAPPAGA